MQRLTQSTHLSPKAKTKGFTIIEVLFVLSIAGIILVVVFQAIPTLQRNSRNNERKQDITAILSATSTYMLNNSGNMPPHCSGSPPVPRCDTVFMRHTPLRFYHVGNINVNLCSSALVNTPEGQGCAENVHRVMPGVGGLTAASANWMKVYNYYRCDIDATDGQPIATRAGAGYFDVVAMYHVELGGGNVAFECMQL